MSTQKIFAAGLGLQTFNAKGQLIATRYSKAFVRSDSNGAIVDDFVELCTRYLSYAGGNKSISLAKLDFKYLIQKFHEHSGTVEFLEMTKSEYKRVVVTLLETDEAPNDINEAFLKLTLLSNLSVKPHAQDINGIFGVLQNLAWTNEGPIDLSEIDDRLLIGNVNNQLVHIYSVDKFPQMLDFVVPKGIRIADAARVRLGAYLSPGTTVMHEGFVNFNAGTLGQSMIEGRISAGVVIGAGSDLGGSSSTMGTLSGGGEVVISVGKNCLIGANAGIGISLGDNCIVEAGLYITAGTKIDFSDPLHGLYTALARDFSGRSDLLFRRNSQTGAIEIIQCQKKIELNQLLHKND